MAASTAEAPLDGEPTLSMPSSTTEQTGREAATIPPAEPVVIGPLSAEQVYAVLARNIGEVKHCYQEGLWTNPNLAGLVKVRFVITGDRGVTTATAYDSTIQDAAAESCIEKALRRFRFPEPAGGSVVVVRYPFAPSPVI